MNFNPSKSLYQLLLSAACISAPSAVSGSDPLFTRLDAEMTEIRFSNTLIESEALNILNYEYYYNGGGVAAGDINNDGKVDLYFSANTGPNKLYLNQGDLKFQDITRYSGTEGKPGWKTGVTMVDINNDGWLDIYLCHSGRVDTSYRKNELFINNKDLTFSERANEYGLDDNSCSTQAAFFDFDRDGDLDVYLLNHNITTYKNFDIREMRLKRDPIAGDKLFRNDNGRFTDISEQAGIRGSAIGFGLGIATGDINNDGWPDIYIANDYTEPDYLYINNQDGTFTDKLTEMMGHTSHFSMGCEMTDMNNDGWNDVVTLDMLPEDNFRQKEMRGPANYDRYWLQVRYGYHHQVMRNCFQLNNRNGTFSEIGQLAGISNTDWSWTPVAADFDNDGLKDLYITNGYRRNYINMDFLKYTYEDAKAEARKSGQKANLMELVNQIPSIDIPNYLYLNRNGLTFVNAGIENGITENSLSSGAVAADLDNDGDMDLAVNNTNSPAFIYRNNGNPKNHFIKFKLNGAENNLRAIGSRIEIRIGDRIQSQELFMARGYQSSVDPSVQFGTGTSLKVDEAKITWPDGRLTLLKNLDVDRTYEATQSEAKSMKAMSDKTSRKLFQPVDSIISYTHQESDYIDFKTEFLLPHRLSNLGPRIAVGDADGNGMQDLYIGGSAGYSGQLLIQKNDCFLAMTSPELSQDSLKEDGQSLFSDVDGDGDADLIVVSGSNEFQDGSPELQDRIYLNQGKGEFIKSNDRLPSDTIAGLCIRGADIDKDGDQDLFVGGCTRHAGYGLPLASCLLLNDKGKFTDVTEKWCPELKMAGMVMDAEFMDVNADGAVDLIISGEWMAVRVFINHNGRFEESTTTGLESYTGWWNTTTVADMDRDGDMDIIGGNRGTNEQMQADYTHPAILYVKDFDNNGTIDPVINYWIHDGTYPMASRDELLEQMLPLRKKFIYYKKYATATMDSIFTPAQLEGARKLTVTEFRSGWFENDGMGTFKFHPFMDEVQIAPVNAAVVADVNGDKNPDIILAGNNYGLRAEMGRADASFGHVLLGNGKGQFSYLPPSASGLLLNGDCRDLQLLDWTKKRKLLVAAMNNGPVLTYLITP
ncbi:MAG: VCBS repeat-containing protein [Bacteroidota bacterium]